MAGLVLVWTMLASSCIHINDYGRLKFSDAARLEAPPSAAINARTSNLARGAAAMGLLASGIALAGWRWRRLHGEGSQPGAVDREDLALIRTARDALAYLLRKRFARLKVVSLLDFQRRRGARGP